MSKVKFIVDNRNDSSITPDVIKSGIQLNEQLISQQGNKSISAMDLLNRQIKNIPCLIEPFLQKVGLACIAGSSDTGKSSFLRYLCMCIVSGESDFLGFSIRAERKRAIYVSTEDDETAVAYLLNKQNRDLQALSSSVQELRFIFDTENLLRTLDDELTKAPADIVCIDAFTDLYGRSMNESNQVRAFLNDYSQLAQKHQCLMLFLHHCGKRSEELEPSKHNLLGSQAFEAKMRLVMELRSDIIDASLKHLCIVKGNYLPAEYKNESYQLRFTENMTFINTGERMPFDNLVKTGDCGIQKYEHVKRYLDDGHSYSQAAERFGFANKSSIARLVKRHEMNGVAISLHDATESNGEKQRQENE